jgi:hypothetical protein
MICPHCQARLPKGTYYCKHCRQNIPPKYVEDGALAAAPAPPPGGSLKTCPFCAEDIQAAAIVCKHCGRDLKSGASQVQLVAPQSSKTSPAVVLLTIVFGVVGILGMAWCAAEFNAPDAGAARLLKFTATKGPMGCSITNRESSPVRACSLEVRESDGTIWSADDSRELAPLETRNVPWSAFTAQGQPMPGTLGVSRGVYVSCLVTGSNQRLTAAFR